MLIGSKSFHQREEVSTIRTALRAIEWTEDELSVYATLRNVFGVLDSTLFKFRETHGKGRLRYFGDIPPELDAEYQTIADAYAMLRELHRQRNGRPIAQTINDLLTPIRGFSTLAFRKGGKRVLANVYRLLDIARSYELTEATSFRSFIDYLEEQAEGGEAKKRRFSNKEGDAVKLINVHKAKGLEFPVVILATFRPRSSPRKAADDMLIRTSACVRNGYWAALRRPCSIIWKRRTTRSATRQSAWRMWLRHAPAIS